MADKINGLGRGGLDVTQARGKGSARAERADRTGGRGEAERARSSGNVRLTEAANSLKQAEAALRNSPDVDRARVERVRQQVETGAYQVNAGRLADRLLAFERDLV
jgi:negative regulator of flagellin synthesis FlgM